MVGNNYTELAAAERLACITSGVLDITGTFTAGSPTGTGDFYIIDAESPDGALRLQYDARNHQIHLIVRGVTVLSTLSVGANPAAGTMQNWTVGDRVDWRVWYSPAGGARSMGIRWAVNGVCGNDTTGTGSGAALAALTSAKVLITAAGTWSATSTILTGPTSANVAARGVFLGDSIVTPRATHPALPTFFGATGAVACLAQGGATSNNQLTTWMGSRHRGDAGVVWAVIQIGINDLGVDLDTPAQALADIQALVSDIRTNNPTVKIVICPIAPCRFWLGETRYPSWQAINEGILGGGATPITGVDARVSGVISALGDANDTLIYHIDNLHLSEIGRVKNAQPISAALSSLGVL